MILWSKILVACIPAAIIGILFDEVCEKIRQMLMIVL